MKYLLITLSFLLLLSCKQGERETAKTTITKQDHLIEKATPIADENPNAADINKLNEKIAQSTETLSPKDIMKLYYPYEVESEEGNEKITISEKVLDNTNVEVVLIHDNMMDDSVRGEKHTIELKKQGDRWNVLSLQKSWKCWEGRGHTDWGETFCI